MKEYFVYILECNDKSYYTGITNNLERRINEHNNGINDTSYTCRRRPLILKYYCRFTQVKQAIAFEKQIKGWSRKKKEALINEHIDTLKELAICKNETHYSNNAVDASSPLSRTNTSEK